MDLHWHSYTYYPYERDLAIREIRGLLSPKRISTMREGLCLTGVRDASNAERLVYFAETADGKISSRTIQAQLERVNGNEARRQSTRYSVHGLHEYKGKFNPQIARAILNIFGLPQGAKIFDPFCGSGTSLVECAHLGMSAVGTDINPLAVFIANAKLSALRLPAIRVRSELKAVVDRYRLSGCFRVTPSDERIAYLASWFDPVILTSMERLRHSIMEGSPATRSILLSIASNLLRDYSLQDPNDLRIRRRKSPLPETPLIEAFEIAANGFLSRLENAQSVLPPVAPDAKAFLADCRAARYTAKALVNTKFDCALTSPPYATALPYIDTQRLSLVWLDLLPSTEILRLESQLVGSREVRGESKSDLRAQVIENRGCLPDEQAEYCRSLQAALSSTDGFRRQAVPLLLYRYFAAMQEAFRSIRHSMMEGAPFALIVGGNHTVLGGKRFDIDTPHHLSRLATTVGWKHDESIPLQTYQRYGYHMKNAVASESMVILRAS
jgi:hypothetical protein